MFFYFVEIKQSYHFNSYPKITTYDIQDKLQEKCIRLGLMERAYHLFSSNTDEAVRTNINEFLTAIGLKQYTLEIFDEMFMQIAFDMHLSSKALCLAIWRLVNRNALEDAKNVQKLSL